MLFANEGKNSGGHFAASVESAVGDDADDAAGAVFDDHARARGKLLALIAQDRLPSAEHETFDLNGERVHAALFDEQGDPFHVVLDERLEAVGGRRSRNEAEHVLQDGPVAEDLVLDGPVDEVVHAFEMVVERAAVEFGLLGDHADGDVGESMMLEQGPECVC